MSSFGPEVVMLIPVLFTLFIGVGAFIYWFSSKIAPKSNPTGHKLEPYAGGEKIEGGKIQMNYNLFFIAVFFTVMHVFALMLATMLGGSWTLSGIIAAIYTIIGIICVIVLLSR
jgi:NADH:ubiquinone oxidoreductase subunit 3 (subunit A)